MLSLGPWILMHPETFNMLSSTDLTPLEQQELYHYILTPKSNRVYLYTYSPHLYLFYDRLTLNSEIFPILFGRPIIEYITFLYSGATAKLVLYHELADETLHSDDIINNGLILADIC